MVNSMGKKKDKKNAAESAGKTNTREKSKSKENGRESRSRNRSGGATKRDFDEVTGGSPVNKRMKKSHRASSVDENSRSDELELNNEVAMDEDGIEIQVSRREVNSEFPHDTDGEVETDSEIDEDGEISDEEIVFNQNANSNTMGKTKKSRNAVAQQSKQKNVTNGNGSDVVNSRGQRGQGRQNNNKEVASEWAVENAVDQCFNEKFQDKILKFIKDNGFVRKEDIEKERQRGNNSRHKSDERQDRREKEQHHDQRNYHDYDRKPQHDRHDKQHSKGNGMSESIGSETTLYKGAVRMEIVEPENNLINTIAMPNPVMDKEKRCSSSSEDIEMVDTSDELIEMEKIIKPMNNVVGGGRYVEDGQRPHTSRDEGPPPLNIRNPGDIRADELVRQAEKSKAKMYNVAGKDDDQVHYNDNLTQHPIFNGNMSREIMHSVLVDEHYSLVAAHVEDNVKRKIIMGEFVDFEKLLPRDKVASMRSSNVMDMVNIDGKPAWAPVSERSQSTISSFSKWEQAFRVFSNIYTDRYPSRATELIQYNHIIYSASLTFVWENVYLYDQDFRIHISQFPDRSWGVILQHAWNLRLHERLTFNSMNGNKSGSKKRDVCWRFNRGKCSYGQGCKFGHKCALCQKYGHGASNCRRGRNSTGGYNDHGYNGYRRNDRNDRNDYYEKETGERYYGGNGNGNGNGNGRKDWDRRDYYKK